MVRIAACALAILAAVAPAAAQDDGPDPGPFEQGRSRISIILATQQQGDDTAWIVGGGYGYYLVNGLELGLEAVHWFNTDPSVTQLAPQARYVLWYVPVLKPY